MTSGLMSHCLHKSGHVTCKLIFFVAPFLLPPVIVVPPRLRHYARVRARLPAPMSIPTSAEVLRTQLSRLDDKVRQALLDGSLEIELEEHIAAVVRHDSSFFNLRALTIPQKSYSRAAKNTHKSLEAERDPVMRAHMESMEAEFNRTRFMWVFSGAAAEYVKKDPRPPVGTFIDKLKTMMAQQDKGTKSKPTAPDNAPRRPAAQSAPTKPSVRGAGPSAPTKSSVRGAAPPAPTKPNARGAAPPAPAKPSTQGAAHPGAVKPSARGAAPSAPAKTQVSGPQPAKRSAIKSTEPESAEDSEAENAAPAPRKKTPKALAPEPRAPTPAAPKESDESTDEDEPPKRTRKPPAVSSRVYERECDNCRRKKSPCYAQAHEAAVACVKCAKSKVGCDWTWADSYAGAKDVRAEVRKLAAAEWRAANGVTANKRKAGSDDDDAAPTTKKQKKSKSAQAETPAPDRSIPPAPKPRPKKRTKKSAPAIKDSDDETMAEHTSAPTSRGPAAKKTAPVAMNETPAPKTTPASAPRKKVVMPSALASNLNREIGAAAIAKPAPAGAPSTTAGSSSGAKGTGKAKGKSRLYCATTRTNQPS